MLQEAGFSEGALQEEAASNRFPIVEDERSYYSKRRPEPQEGMIIHFKVADIGGDKGREYFLLQKTIAGLRFVFTLNEYAGTYQLSFKTEEYEYATINLEEADRDALFRTLAEFVESAADRNPNLREILVDPSNASYSREEIDQCVDLILASPKNKFTREELFSQYKGFKIFDLYERVFDKGFHEVHYNNTSRDRGRGRLFKIIVGKYFPGWIIEDQFGSGFIIRKKPKDKPAASSESS